MDALFSDALSFIDFLIFNQCSPGPKIERVFQTGFDDAGTWS